MLQFPGYVPLVPVGSSSESPLPIYEDRPHPVPARDGEGGTEAGAEAGDAAGAASSENSTASPESGSYHPHGNGSTGKINYFKDGLLGRTRNAILFCLPGTDSAFESQSSALPHPLPTKSAPSSRPQQQQDEPKYARVDLRSKRNSSRHSESRNGTPFRGRSRLVLLATSISPACFNKSLFFQFQNRK